MFDPGNAGFWTQSLMVSLICAMLVLPALVMMGQKKERVQSAVDVSADEFKAEDMVPASFFSSDNPFAKKSSDSEENATAKSKATDTLWPENDLQNA